MTRRTLLAWMALAIAVACALAIWDERRESGASLDDFAAEQATVAKALASAMDAKRAAGRDEAAPIARELARAVEQPGEVIVLVRPPATGTRLVGSAGAWIESEAIASALDRGVPFVRLARPEAAALGLPARMAMAGLATIDGWGVAVVATAQRERDRERRAEGRLALGLFVAAGLVLAFGGVALRMQRKELELARELAVAEIEKQRDSHLAQANKAAALGALAMGVAHEVATPLGVIVGRAEQLAAKVEGDERSKRAVETIVAQAQRIDHVVRGLLAMVRGDRPSLERVDVASLAQAAADLVAHRFAKAGVALRTTIAADLPRALCDARLFEQVLANLLLNACEASEKSSAVSFRVERAPSGVAFTVDDEGAGISAEAAARATEPFFTTKSAKGGSGLGLAIASEIVAHHRGTLSVGPRPDGRRGTRARVELPATSPPPGSSHPEP